MKDAKDPNQKRDEGYATAAARFKDCFNIDLINLKMKQCTKNMFEEFVDFLMAYDKNSRLTNSTEEIEEIKYYALGTVHQYLSGVYNHVQDIRYVTNVVRKHANCWQRYDTSMVQATKRKVCAHHCAACD